MGVPLAVVIEIALGLSARSQHPQLADDEALLIRHLVKRVRDEHDVVDEGLTRVVDVDPEDIGAGWQPRRSLNKENLVPTSKVVKPLGLMALVALAGLSVAGAAR
ncbi:hypothetical protein [Arthrobacter sp. SLBN-83]|uniref:hypothetical protein n=1 Tax=Arthrobacter sp. SLBN-83 TaxID=2768449 RepID=UPI00190FA101|nr:hypothetical protein [Arthrobacter sp. SLBN-83]